MELDDGSMQCTNCPFIRPRYVRMIMFGQQTSFNDAKLEDPVIPTFQDFLVKSADDKYSIPCWPQHVIAAGQPDVPTQVKMLNYENLCIRKALLVQQNTIYKLVQMEAAQQKAQESHNTNFHNILASLKSLESHLT